MAPATSKSTPDSQPPDPDKNEKKSVVLQKAAAFRPELTALDAICIASDRSVFADFLSLMHETQPLSHRLIVCNIDKYEGNELYKKGYFELARAKYLVAAKKILGEEFRFPIAPRCVKVNEYMKLEWREMMDVAACFNNMAQCFIKEGNIREALEWLQEVVALYLNQLFAREPVFAWRNSNLLVEEYYLNQQKYHLRLSQSFLALKNTSSVVYHSWAVISVCAALLESKTARMVKLSEEANASKHSEYRHPDIRLEGRLEVDYPELQIRGKWVRCRYVTTESARPPSPRAPMGCWIWRGSLYVAGGQGASRENLRDLWHLPLGGGPLEKTWRRLQDIPPSSKGGPPNSCIPGLHMKPWKNTAYLFYGSKTILTFDLVQEKWSSKTTKFSIPGKSWPYFEDILIDYGMEIYKGKMYIFGGNDGHGRRQLGCNVFMCLDLGTLSWEWLSGTSQPIPTYDSPMLRVHPLTWILPSEGRLFVMYGNANRIGENYDDIWSYHIPRKTWTREKVCGNYPSPRTEFPAIYNHKMDRVVVFGGYCGTTSTCLPEMDANLGFAYYADTYIWHPKTRKWAQVLTRGFPTYRARGKLLFDAGSGKTYLFSGYTNADFAFSKHGYARTFNDLWELKLDVEDGELEDEERTAVMGPWGTCFDCGEIGLWGMCGGSCRGAVRYCSDECKERGWKEHKLKHGCVNNLSKRLMKAGGKVDR